MATHSSILAWRIPWTKELGGLQSMGLQESDTTEWLSLLLLQRLYANTMLFDVRNCYWTQVHVPEAQWGQANWSIRVWSRERFTAGLSKVNRCWEIYVIKHTSWWKIATSHKHSFSVDSVVKNLPAVQEMQVQSLDQEEPLKREVVTHSSILAREIPWTEEPCGLQSMGSQKSITHLSNKRTTIKSQNKIKLMILVSTCVWEDARIWSHWNFSLDVHFNYLRPIYPKHKALQPGFYPEFLSGCTVPVTAGANDLIFVERDWFFFQPRFF